MKVYNNPETEVIALNSDNLMQQLSMSPQEPAPPGAGGDAPSRIGSLGPGY